MAVVHFTRNLQRHVECPSSTVEGQTVAEALARVFDDNPELRGYVLDDQGALRPHVAVFVNGALIHDRTGLTDPVGTGDELHVMQALSGG